MGCSDIVYILKSLGVSLVEKRLFGLHIQNLLFYAFDF